MTTIPPSAQRFLNERRTVRRRSSVALGDPLTTNLMLGFGLVVVSATFCIFFGAGPLGTIVGVVASSVVASSILASQLRDRADRATQICNDLDTEVTGLQTRWDALNAESIQTNSVLAQMRDGVIVLAPDRSILLINPSAKRLLAFALTDSLLNLLFPEIVRFPDLNRAVEACASGDGAQEVIIEVRDEAILRPVRVRVDRITTTQQSNLLLTLTDETESRRIDEMRREFIANVSHELKTPLAAIKGYAETVELAIEDDPAAATHFMSQIQTQCLRLERLVADMMQLARAQAGRDKLRLVTVQLSDVISESLKSYRPVASAKEIELTVDAESPGARITADREATLTIVNNLIGNAVRYTPDGGAVRVGVRKAGSFWAIYVSDTGVGIPESEQERIFERFYRVEKTRESERGGTGLGLSIVKNLTLAQGGEVRLKSRPGEGSTFEVLLPAITTKDEPILP